MFAREREKRRRARKAHVTQLQYSFVVGARHVALRHAVSALALVTSVVEINPVTLVSITRKTTIFNETQIEIARLQRAR